MDGMEAVTQVEDVPAQLEAEQVRKAEKIKVACERRSKALQEK
jgi:hypothetical protein